MKTSHTPGKRIKSSERLFDILETIKRLEGATLGELADELDMAKSTVHDHLSTLLHRGYVVKRGDTYDVGLLFLDLGSYARRRNRLFKYVKSKIDWLAEETNERTQFMVEEHGRGYDVYRSHGYLSVATGPRIGKPVLLHKNAAGKSILASLPRERVESILDHWGQPRYTEHTITDRETLFRELDAVRANGYAINGEESQEGIRAIGIAVVCNEECIGAISVSGPVHRIQGSHEEEIINLLQATKTELEQEHA